MNEQTNPNNRHHESNNKQRISNRNAGEERYILSNNGRYITLSENDRIGVTTNPADATLLTRKQVNRFRDGGWGSKKARGFVPRSTGDMGDVVAGEYNGITVVTGDARCGTKQKPISKTTRVDVYNRAEGRCAICGQFVPCNEFTIDHITPVSCGGDDVPENLQMTCLTCNKMKSDLMMGDMMRHIVEILRYQVASNDIDGELSDMLYTLAEKYRQEKKKQRTFARLKRD